MAQTPQPQQPSEAQNQQQQSPQVQTTAGGLPLIKTETRLVLVDAIVTDKQGNYVPDLTEKDFRVWEDDKEQSITSFSFESSASLLKVNPSYLVLFFDDSNMSAVNQAMARYAAVKFVGANAGPDRYIAALEYTGVLTVTQDFTADGERLKQVVKKVKYASLTANPSLVSAPPGAACRVLRQQTDYGARSVLQAIREVARNLASVPGRKSLILLTTGFPMARNGDSDLMATIDACNKANVSIYPIDVSGLTIEGAPPSSGKLEMPGGLGSAALVTAAIHTSDETSPEEPAARLVYVSGEGSENRSGVKPGSVPGGGGHPGGIHPTGGGTGGTGGKPGGVPVGTNGGGTTRFATGTPNINPGWRSIRPRFDPLNPPLPPLKLVNHQVLYALAIGTGGFVIINSNDLLGGMEKVAEEAKQYYVLGYAPAPSQEGSCHSLRVKMQRSGLTVRSRSGYCNVKPPDALAGKPIEKQLEAHAMGASPGNVSASMRAAYFYSSPNVARVDVAIEIPPGAVKLSAQHGKFVGTVDVLGLAYKQDGTLAARFSDSLPLEVENKRDLQEFNRQPLHYSHQFLAAPDKYDLKLVLTCGGDNFAKLEMPLAIEPYNGTQLAISTVVFSKEIYSLSRSPDVLDAALLEDRVPFVSRGVQFVPSGSEQFKKGQPGAFYVEIYDPLLAGANPPKVSLQVRVIDQKTGAAKVNAIGAAPDAKAGSLVVPVGLKIPIETLPPGAYRLELEATDSTGAATPVRSTDFELE